MISRYLEIDDEACVMELVKHLENDTLIDTDGRDKLVGKLKGYQDKLYIDPVTGVYNRRYFEDEIRNMQNSAGVAMIDLDDFKLYNDIYGHDMGDQEMCIRDSHRCGTWYIVSINAFDSRAERKEYTFIKNRIRVH